MPAGRDWSAHEEDLWESLWSGPQANAWDDSFIPTVAVFVIYNTTVMQGAASAWMAQELRHAAQALGLTPSGMAALGWKIADR